MLKVNHQLASLCIIFQLTIFQTCKHHYKIISHGNGKFVAYKSFLKCHVQNKLTGLRRVYVGIGSLFCIVNLLIAPVTNVLMRLSCQGKGTEYVSRK